MGVRIAHVVADVDDEAKGPSYSVVRLSEAQAAAGHEVSLHTLGSRQVHTSVRVHVYPSARCSAGLGVSSSMHRALQEVAGSVDILHSHGLWLMPNLYPAWAARRRRAKLVVSPRGMLDPAAVAISRGRKQAMWVLAQRRALDQADLFHATSEMEARAIRARGFDQPIAVVPNGVDIPELESVKRTRTVLYLGRIHRKKRIDRLLHAWRTVSPTFPEWSLRIVGPEDDRSHMGEVRRLTEESANTSLVPPVYGGEKSRHYQSAAIVVLPTDSENFGLVVAEALAAGTPVIVTTRAPWSGVEEKGCGWWVEPSVEGVASALEHAMTLGLDKLSDMGAAGRRWMQQEFAWPIVARMMSGWYADLSS